MSHLQGPALYAYNDAVFSQEDWRGLRTLFDSIKAKDPMKVGRFGLGFKSVFHMTGTVKTINTLLADDFKRAHTPLYPVDLLLPVLECFHSCQFYLSPLLTEGPVMNEE